MKKQLPIYYTTNFSSIRNSPLGLNYIFPILLLIVSTFTIKAQQTVQNYNLLQIPAFTENKGQVTDQEGHLLPEVKYIYKAPGFKLILKENSLSYEVFTVDKNKNQEQIGANGTGLAQNTELPAKYKVPEDFTINTHRIDVDFIGANPNPEIIAEEKNNDFNNYYLAHTPEEGVKEVNSYKKLTYKNLYPDIDIVFYAKEEGKLKYDIVVHPGGRLENIKMKYNGMSDLSLVNSKIKIQTLHGDIIEEIPVSFLNENKENVNIDYTFKNELVGFIGKYNKNKTLVIDPLISWGTYYGDSGDDLGESIKTDSNRNVFITGYTTSSSSISTTGAYQTSHNGGTYDAFIIKFNANGVRQWGTYYGGNQTEFGYNLSLDNKGFVYIIGYTSSTSGMATSGSYQSTLAGGSDAFISKFNNNGIRQWGTYFGGNDNDLGRYIYVDNNNIYISGNTYSNSGLASSGAHQTTFGGTIDAFIAKFNNNGGIKWSTYYGGTSYEFGGDICTDKFNNIYYTGTTGSSSNISTSGAHKTLFGGGDEAFIVKFDSIGIRQWGTYYGGSNSDNVTGVSIDDSSNIYISGTTFSSSGIATTGAFKTNISNYDGYIVKFNTNGNRVWGTYYGGNDYDELANIIINTKRELYVTGSTKSTTNLSTNGAYQRTNAGKYDAFLAKFTNNGQRLWSTYYGGGEDDKSLCVAIDDSDYVYITGNTISNSGISTPNAHQKYISNYKDAYVAKFPDMFCDVSASLKGDTIFCYGQSKSYTANKGSGYKYNWTVNGGTITSGQGTDSIRVAWGSAGTGSLKLVVSVTAYCKDSVIRNIVINPLPAAVVGNSSTICKGQKITLGTSYVSGSIYSWTSEPAGFTSSASNPTVSPDTTTSYYLTEINNITGCEKSDTVIITVNPSIVDNTISSSQTICSGRVPAQLKAGVPTGGGGNYSYLWESSTISPNSGFYPAPGINNQQDYAPGILTKTTYFRRTASTSVCKGTQSVSSSIFTITILPPVADNTISSSQHVCSGQALILLTGSTPIGGNGSYFYSWQDSVSGGKWNNIANTSDYTPVAMHNSKNTDSIIYYRRIATSGECKGTQSSISNIITITVHPLPSVAINGKQLVCLQDVSEYSVTLDSGASAGWIVTGGNIIKGQGTNKIIVEWPDIGSGSVKVLLTNKSGCKNTSSLNVNINELPVADFSANRVCQGVPALFTNHSTGSASYLWDFGDGNSDTVAHPNHAYGVAGTYHVQLKVISKAGCIDSVSKFIIIDSLPVAGFNFNDTCFGNSINFNNTSTGSVSYLWQFGNGFTSTLSNPSYQYLSVGKYSVKLQVWNAAGCSDSVSKIITINPLPVSTISVNQDTLEKRTYTFISMENASQYLWSFGDGTIDSGKIVNHTFLKDSIYKISLAVRDTNGCTDITDTTINVFTVGINKLSAPAFELKLYPNPFTNTTTLAYNLQEKAKTEISVYDLTGKEIAVLQKGMQPEGLYKMAINGNKYQLKAGIYILKVQIGNQFVNRQLIRLKE